MASILTIDDDKLICNAISDLAAVMGHDTAYGLTMEDGLRQIASKAFDLVFLDVHLPDGNGIQVLEKIRQMLHPPEVVVITGRGCPATAERSIKNHAWEYIEKPLSIESVKHLLIRSLQYREHNKKKEPALQIKTDRIIGASAAMKECMGRLADAARSEINVLLTGETGTGKELFARAIHENSGRNAHAFVVVDCAAIPENLVESTLFGHKKGAFTGADRNHEGLVKQAHMGSLFLDEVGELPLSVQKKLLRVLEERRFLPVGGSEEIGSDFRLISATNRDLSAMVQEKRFRKDLLFRLQSMMIQLPPLRERKKDIFPMAMHYVNKFCNRLGAGVRTISPEFVESLNRYNWPGNVRQLVHAMERAVAGTMKEDTLFPIHLPEEIRLALAKGSTATTPQYPLMENTDPATEDFPTVPVYLANKEKEYLKHLIARANGSMKEACRMSGLSRTVFFARLKQYNIR